MVEGMVDEGDRQPAGDVFRRSQAKSPAWRSIHRPLTDKATGGRRAGLLQRLKEAAIERFLRRAKVGGDESPVAMPSLKPALSSQVAPAATPCLFAGTRAPRRRSSGYFSARRW